MSRQEDFKKSAIEYTDGEPEGAQKIIGQVGYEFGCEHGYQYAIDKACEWLEDNLSELVKDQEMIGTICRYMYKKDNIEQFRKAMQ